MSHSKDGWGDDLVGWLKGCFTSTETVGLLGTGAQDGHLDSHTAPELCVVAIRENDEIAMAHGWVNDDDDEDAVMMIMTTRFMMAVVVVVVVVVAKMVMMMMVVVMIMTTMRFSLLWKLD